MRALKSRPPVIPCSRKPHHSLNKGLGKPFPTVVRANGGSPVKQQDHQGNGTHELRTDIRDRVYRIAAEHAAWTPEQLAEETGLLGKDAREAGYPVIAGLADAFSDALKAQATPDRLAVYLAYLTRALELEPCDREAGAILNLLETGIRRRLAEIPAQPPA